MLTYDLLKQFDGMEFYTVDQAKPAIQHVDNAGVAVVYPSERDIHISRQAIETVMRRLMQTKSITRDQMLDIEGMTKPKGTKLVAILAQLTEQISVTLRPRTLHYHG